MAPTLTRRLIADITDRSANVTAAVLAPEQTSSEQVKHSILTLIAGPSSNRRFARALARLQIAGIQSAHGAIGEAVAGLTSIRIRYIQIPVQWLALVANTSSHATLALTEFSRWHGTAPTESRSYSSWVAVAFLTSRIIVEPFLALVTVLPVKVVAAEALTLGVTRNTRRSVQIAIARQTLGVLEIPRTALVALTSCEVGCAMTTATGIATRRGAAGERTIAGHTVRIVVITGNALITTRSSESFTAQALARLLVTDLIESSSNVAVAV